MNAFAAPLSLRLSSPKSRRRSLCPRMVAPRTVVVGAGPAGLSAAYILHEQGSNVTLIEKAMDPAAADPSRAFSYLIMPRGMKAIERMGLSDTLMKAGTATASMTVNSYEHKKEPRKISIAPLAQRRSLIPESYWIARSKLVRLMLDRVQSLPGVDVRLGNPVRAVEFSVGGARVYIDGDDAPFEADLVIAGDGIRSIVRSSLHSGCAGSVACSSDFDLTKHNSAAVGLPYKTLILGAAPKLPVLQEDGTWLDSSARPEESYVFRGALRGAESLRLGLLPVGTDITSPRTGTMAIPANRAIWRARSTDAAYDLFQRNFPFLDVRDLVKESEMARFATAEPSHFPPIQRCNSLVGTCGEATGVCLVGDAAHAFPPDLGQGVNSALEDVILLSTALAEHETVGGALRAYEDDRSEDIDALLRLMQLGHPYQYRQNMAGYYLIVFNQLIRNTLHSIWPKWFFPQVFLSINQGRYRDVLHKANVTTRRLYGILAVFVIFVAIIVAR